MEQPTENQKSYPNSLDPLTTTLNRIFTLSNEIKNLSRTDFKSVPMSLLELRSKILLLFKSSKQSLDLLRQLLFLTEESNIEYESPLMNTHISINQSMTEAGSNDETRHSIFRIPEIDLLKFELFEKKLSLNNVLLNYKYLDIHNQDLTKKLKRYEKVIERFELFGDEEDGDREKRMEGILEVSRKKYSRNLNFGRTLEPDFTSGRMWVF